MAKIIRFLKRFESQPIGYILAQSSFYCGCHEILTLEVDEDVIGVLQLKCQIPQLCGMLACKAIKLVQ
jgi:hypothetical protein